MHVEAALIDRLGDVGRKLHTARSRNDQVATDVKLWTRDALDRIDARLVGLQRAFVRAAERHPGLILPGYTHLQRAQPVLAAHYFLAFVEKLARDRDRVADCRKRLNVLPLGAAALAGTTLPIDRDHVARSLGFDGVTANSLDTSSDRDFALESAFVLTLIAEHLSGWAEEWVIWSTQEFSFLVARRPLHRQQHHAAEEEPRRPGADPRPDRPGRRGPDDPPGPHQGPARWPTTATSRRTRSPCSTPSTPWTPASTWPPSSSKARPSAPTGSAARLDEGFLDATTLMEYLIKQGVPQRTGHEIVGRLVGLCESKARLPPRRSERPKTSPEAHPLIGRPDR